MLRNGIVLAVLCLVPALASAQAARGPFELELGGTGANGPNFNGFTAGGDVNVGFFVTDMLELGVRQSLNYSDIGGVSWDATTRAAADLNIPLGDQGQFVPFVGANIGYVYGKGVRDTWEAAPEGGLKVFINATTFIYGSLEYQFFFNQNSNSSVINNGQFIYTLGVGVRF
jgi:hypothetical protein